MEKVAVETKKFKGQLNGASKILSIASPSQSGSSPSVCFRWVNVMTMDSRVNIAEPNATNVVKYGIYLLCAGVVPVKITGRTNVVTVVDRQTISTPDVETLSLVANAKS